MFDRSARVLYADDHGLRGRGQIPAGRSRPTPRATRDARRDAGPAIDQEDIYLSHPSRDFRVTNEALRIRRIGDENRITYKGPRLSGPTKTREEIEISLDHGQVAFEQLLRLLENLGFSAGRDDSQSSGAHARARAGARHRGLCSTSRWSGRVRRDRDLGWGRVGATGGGRLPF